MKILMVCLGNICRSPLAKGILLHKVSLKGLSWEVDSAGTGSYHIGAPPHSESINVAREKSIDISHFTARQVTKQDLNYYDLILVMDSSNYQDVYRLCENNSQMDKIKLIRNYVNPGRNQAVPDPYHNGRFREVYNILDEATEALIRELSNA